MALPMITLSDSGGSRRDFTGTYEYISAKENYTVATVENGSWIIYNTEPEYGIDYQYKVMLTKEYETLEKPITAVRLIEYAEPGICLFADHHFFGYFKTFTGNVNKPVSVAEFPVNKYNGVSSLIVMGSSSWILHYRTKSGEDRTATVHPGAYDEMGKIADGDIKDDQIFMVERAD